MQTEFRSGSLFAPRRRLSAAADQRFQVRLLVLPVRSRSLVAAFRSLGTTVRSPNHRSEVDVPDLLLQNRAESSSGPLAFCSLAYRGFDTTTGEFNAQTRYLKAIQYSRFLLASHSRRGFSSPANRCANDSVPGKLAFRIRPISLRSPLPALVKVPTTDQRSRFATFP